MKFLKWGLTDGQKYAEPLNYAPLPHAVIDKELAQINEIVVAERRSLGEWAKADSPRFGSR